MKVRKEFLEKVKTNTNIRRKLGRGLELSDASISRILRENKDNGDLTKIVAVQIMASELDIPESVILE